MAEMNNDLQTLEAEFISLRCKLRQLGGRVKLFNSIDHPNGLSGIKSANDRTAKEMLRAISYSLCKMDEYEYQRDYWFEREAGFEKINSLSVFKLNDK